MEEYKQIPGFSDYYVSNLGNVKSMKYNRERILKPYRSGNYLGVWLGAGNRHYVHRLVACIFIGYNDQLEVDHINRNKHDNRLENLRWLTANENCRNTGHLPNNKLGEKNISMYRGKYWVRIYRNEIYVFTEWYNSLQEAISARDNFLANE
jgi:hypothetical protein